MLYLKALHIIFVVTWFAGLFYIVRLFIYHAEAVEEAEKSGSDQKKQILVPQYKLMQKRLWYGITWPSALLTAVFGFWVLTEMDLWKMPYMHVKLTFVALLYAYHFICHRQFARFQNDKPVWNSTKLRVWNEAATVFLVAIVFIIVLKSAVDWVYGLIGLLLFTAVLLTAIKVYRRLRNK